jgi:uncharacterized membrane protein YhaH (DUF805 family)
LILGKKKQILQFPRYGGPDGGNIMEWMLMPLKRYAEFSGRSRRKEYWMFVLGMFLLYVVLFALLMVLGGSALLSAGSNPAGMASAVMSMGALGLVFLVVWLALLIPTIAVTIRRLHDTDRSGWWLGALFGLAIVMEIAARISGSLYLIFALAYFALAVALLVFYCLEGTKGPNRYGDDPKGAGAAEVFA